MMKKLLLLFVLSAGFAACESEEEIPGQPFVAAFEKRSYDHRTITASQTMALTFSETAAADGFVRISIASTAATYGTDFETFPAAVGNELVIPFSKGDAGATFEFHNLIYPFVSFDKSIKFEITAIDYPLWSNIQGYTSAVVSFSASLGATVTPAVGGPNQGNQVYFDLSTETAKEVWRDSWDLGFYAGDDFRVALNGSIYMAAKRLDATNIDAVTEASVLPFQSEVTIGTFDPANAAFIDNPNGLTTGNAMGEVSAIEADNHVYLVNLGYTVGTYTPAVGSVAVAGDQRGWKKVKVTREGNGYRLQYANLNSTTHEEVVITKNPDYNFTFFSFNTNNVVSVEPQKDKWDLGFTVFTNVIDGSGSYGYSDFVLNNLKAGIKAYRVNVASGVSYNDYALGNVNEASFENDQRVIGADWRDVFTGSAFTDRFYVLKDAEGNIYKIKMLGFLNQSGVRGYPKFEYKLLQ